MHGIVAGPGNVFLAVHARAHNNMARTFPMSPDQGGYFI